MRSIIIATAAAVGKAVHAVLEDVRYRVRAHELADGMRQAGGLPVLNRIIDQGATASR